MTFWEAYPKKEAKGIAYKAFEKINPDNTLVQSMLETLERQKRSKDWQKDEGQYIPHPATWLNGRRWEDETPASSSSPSTIDERWPRLE